MIRIIDIYITRKFISTLIFAVIALCAIFMVVNLLENLDDFIDADAGVMIIAKYYFYSFPEILKVLVPIATLLATLFSIGGLSNSNEITAMKSGGQSLYRLMLPLMAICIMLSFGQLYFNGWLVPKAVEQKMEIEFRYLNKGSRGGSLYNLYFREKPTENVIINYYNSETKTGNKPAIEYYTSEMNPRLTQRIEAKKIIWDSSASKWLFIDAILRDFDNKMNVTAQRIDTFRTDLSFSHDDLIKMKKDPAEMNLEERKDYIALQLKGGKDVRMQKIEYYAEYAFPFANFIVILFGVPFASVRKKGGIAIQIAAAMIVSFVYLVFTKFSQTIGYAADWDPIFAGWFPNILFLIVGFFTIIKTKT